MQPMNYNINAGNPFASALQGYQGGNAIQQQQVQQQQQTLQIEQQKQMQTDLAALSQQPNPTATDFARITIKYPQLAEHFKNVWAPLNEEQKQSKLDNASQILAAVNSGNIDIAKGILQKQADAATNSGDKKGADTAQAMLQIVGANPGAAKTSISTFLASVLGPEKYAANYESLYKAPVEAQKLGLETANLPTKIALENQNAFQDIETKKLNRDISVLDAQIKGANSETTRGELQVKRDKLVQTQQDKQVAAQTALTGVSQQLDTINRIIDSDIMKPGFNADWTGPGTLSYRIKKLSPLSNAPKDLENLVDTVKSQQFLSNLSQLKAQGGTLGQVTEKEGERMEKALASLETTQSPKAFNTAINIVKKSLENIQGQIVAQGKLPTAATGSGGAFVMKHPKYGTVTEATVNKMLTNQPGLTREQAMEFLKSTGGN